jgi:hypothetical protein
MVKDNLGFLFCLLFLSGAITGLNLKIILIQEKYSGCLIIVFTIFSLKELLCKAA